MCHSFFVIFFGKSSYFASKDLAFLPVKSRQNLSFGTVLNPLLSSDLHKPWESNVHLKKLNEQYSKGLLIQKIFQVKKFIKNDNLHEDFRAKVPRLECPVRFSVSEGVLYVGTPRNPRKPDGFSPFLPPARYHESFL